MEPVFVRPPFGSNDCGRKGRVVLKQRLISKKNAELVLQIVVTNDKIGGRKTQWS